MNIKAIENIRHNGVDYSPGKIINDLTENEGERLIDLGAGVETNEYGPENQEHPQSTEEFGKLKADTQKEVLTSLGIEPATKAEERLQQYEEWLSSNA